MLEIKKVASIIEGKTVFLHGTAKPAHFILGFVDIPLNIFTQM